MKTVAFKVLSSRIHDIELEDGTTVDKLIKILVNNGYDVDGAAIIINRAATGTKLVGQVGDYELNDGDTLEFYKRTCETPALEKAFHEASAAHVMEAECKLAQTNRIADATAQKQECAKACGCTTGRITVRETNNSIEITIQK